MWCSDIYMWKKQRVWTSIGTNNTYTYSNQNSSQPDRLVATELLLVLNPATNSAFSNAYIYIYIYSSHPESVKNQRKTDYFLSMRSTHLNGCFENSLLRELATPAKGKTHNNTSVYELNSFPWKPIKWKLISHFSLQSPAVRNVSPCTQNSFHTTHNSSCIHITSSVINLHTNNTPLKLCEKCIQFRCKSSRKYNTQKWIS